MATQLFRCTYHFNYSNEGFGETWWISGDSLLGIAPKIQRYVDARLAFQPPSVEFGGVRVSVEGQSRKGRTLYPGSNEGANPGDPEILLRTAGTLIISDNDWDLNQLCIQTELLSGGQHLGYRYVGILPDKVSGTGNDPLVMPAEPAFRLAWLAWRQQVITDGWQIRVTQAVPGGEGIVARPELPIRNWMLSAAAPADWQVVMQVGAAPAGWVVGAQVVVRAARMQFSGLRSPNGRWYISAVPTPTDAGTFVVTLKGTAGLDLTRLSNTGKIYLYGATYLSPTTLLPITVTRHKRGGPFPRTVGRRSKPRFPPL